MQKESIMPEVPNSVPNFQYLRADIDLGKLKAAGLDTTALEEKLAHAAAADNLFQHQRELIETAVKAGLTFTVQRPGDFTFTSEKREEKRRFNRAVMQWMDKTEDFRQEALKSRDAGESYFHRYPIQRLEEERKRLIAASQGPFLWPGKYDFPELAKMNKAVAPPAEIPCPDCAHTATPGSYVGLSSVEPCRRCDGKTTLPNPDAKPDKVHNPPTDSSPAEIQAALNQLHGRGRRYEGSPPKFISPSGHAHEPGMKMDVGQDVVAYDPVPNFEYIRIGDGVKPIGEARMHRAGVAASVTQDWARENRNSKQCLSWSMNPDCSLMDSFVLKVGVDAYLYQREAGDPSNKLIRILDHGEFAFQIRKDGVCHIDFETTGL